VYASDNDATATLLAERADSLYTRQTWLSADGLINSSGLDYLGSGATRVTRTTPEGTQVIELFQSGRPLNVTVSNTITGLLRKETYGYDQHNRRDTVTDLRTGTLRFTFDDLDRVVTVTTPAPGAGQSAQVTTLVHDDADRVERSQAADGLWTTNELYPNGALRKISGARVYPVEFTYDYAGRPATLKTWQDHAGDSGTAITSWKHDDRGLVTNKLDHTGQGPCYTYTPAGRLATRTWARTVGGQPLITSYHYNDAGDLERIDYSDTTPDVGYAYDRLGRPTHVEGSTTNDYGFTAHGQLLSEDAANSSWSYISQARLGYDALRRRSALTNLTLGLIQFYGYDAASRLDIVSTVHGGLTTMAGYSYLSNSPLVETVTFQRGGTTRLTTARDYDNLNRLKSITSANDTWPDPVSFAYAYNAANQRTGVTNADASHWNYGYDSLGQVTNGWRFWADGSHVLGQTFNYSFDDIGNRRTTETGGDAAGSSLRRATYSANRLNQYTQRTVPGFLEANGTASSPAEVSVNGSLASRQGDYFRQEATVDNSGAALQQWLSILAVNAGKTTTVSRLALVPKTPEAFTHDADGNLTGDGLWDYTWDAENRLTQIELQTNAITDSDCWQRIDCDYDHLNRRIRKRIATWNTHSAGYRLKRSLRYFYDGWNLVGQTDEVTGQRLTFLWGADLSGTLQGAGGVGGLLAMTVHNGPEAGSYFYGFDGNGNVAVLVNAADGSEAARYEYGPFGELIRATGPLASINPFRFSTKYQDDETRLIYYGHRYYSAGTGRWLSEDPIAEQGGMNLYGFVGNHATSGFDPDGLNLYAIDGTGNDRAAESNVSRFFDRYLDGEKHYFGGPGNPSDGIPILGLSHGAGSAGIVDAVIKRICDDLKSNPNITIDLVGFSRGGAIANQVATELDKKGCPCYRGRGRGRKFLSQTKPRIRFLGLFDPVYSFPLIATPFWNDDTIPPNVDNAAIALASDENRKNFRPSILTPSDPDLTSIDLEWFPGVHSDVGGHKDFNSLISNWTLRYMIDQGRSAGLAMDAESDINYLASQQNFENWYKTHPKWFKPTSMWIAAPLTPTTWLHD
jgi:RHS repeat-associated protein